MEEVNLMAFEDYLIADVREVGFEDVGEEMEVEVLS